MPYQIHTLQRALVSSSQIKKVYNCNTKCLNMKYQRPFTLSSSVFGSNKESGATCAYSKTAYTETYWSHQDVTSCNHPKCKQVERWIAIVQWIWRRWRWIRSVLAVYPNVPSNKPCEQEQIQNTVYKFCGHRLVFIHVNVIFVRPSSLTKNYNSF